MFKLFNELVSDIVRDRDFLNVIGICEKIFFYAGKGIA
jgi:hypothetical protein